MCVADRMLDGEDGTSVRGVIVDLISTSWTMSVAFVVDVVESLSCRGPVRFRFRGDR